MQKKWIIKERPDDAVVDSLAKAINVSKPIAQLLVQRGITTFDSARDFFRPDIKKLYNPFLMKDMDKAVARLNKAIVERENVLVYGDYDVDGTTAAAMMYVFLKSKCRNVFYYIPDRYNEGYGISYKGIDFADEKQCKLIIALDCGIKAVQKVEYATSKGIEFIICDHHEEGESLPQAVAVLDPKRSDCSYPFNELSGCGVGFKLIQAYSLQYKIPFYQIKPFLDLVVVSIASDIVPIVDENRILAYYGLRQLNSNPRVGLKAIMDKSKMEPGNLKINDIVFKIGPRINAAGRMDLGQHAVDLLVERNAQTAYEMASKIEDDNTERKTHDQNITQDALTIINSSDSMKERKTTVLYNPMWHKGVIGIVASRLIDYYYRPTIICTKSNGYITGSCRSVAGFNLYSAIESCQELLETFGGHMYAAGLTIKEENLERFVTKFEHVVSKMITPDEMSPRIDADLELDVAEINDRLYRILEQFEPFGPGNMSPVFVSRNVCDGGSVMCVGKDQEHLKFSVSDESILHSIPAIAFRQSSAYEFVKDRKAFDVCYSIEPNSYRGKRSIQLKVCDIKAYGK